MNPVTHKDSDLNLQPTTQELAQLLSAPIEKIQSQGYMSPPSFALNISKQDSNMKQHFKDSNGHQFSEIQNNNNVYHQQSNEKSFDKQAQNISNRLNDLKQKLADKKKEVSEVRSKSNYVSKFIQPQTKPLEESFQNSQNSPTDNKFQSEKRSPNTQFSRKVHSKIIQSASKSFQKSNSPKSIKKGQDSTKKDSLNKSARSFKNPNSGSNKFLFVSNTENQNLTFKPSVDPLSRQLASRVVRSGSGKKRWDQLHEMDRKKRQKFGLKGAQLQQERQIMEEEQCTFSPDLIAKAPNVGITSGDIFKRTQIWDNEKKKKVEREKLSQRQNQTVGCTFHPTTNSKRKAQPKEMINTSGVPKHLERQYIAQKAKLEKEQMILRHLGGQQKSTWKRGVTIPQDFSFDAPGKSIYSMMKPGKPNIWGSGKFKKAMKNSRVDDIIGFAASLNKTQEVKNIFQDPQILQVRQNMQFSDAVDYLHDVLHNLNIQDDF